MKILYLIFFFSFSISHAQSCISNNELNKINTYLKSNSYYSDVPNYINCKSVNRTKLERFVCKKQSLITGFELLSQTNVYAYENAYKKEVSHDDFNIKNLDFIDELILKTSNNIGYENAVCYEIKRLTSDYLGGGTPFLRLQGIDNNQTDNAFFAHKNKNGMVLLNDESIIYLGKSCDVYSKKYGKGKWGQANGGFIIFLGDKSIAFPRQELIMKIKTRCEL